MGKLADAVDSLLEASVVGSFTRLGSAARRSLDHWDAADDSTRPSLEGRVIVITGASSGLGLATASALAARGATIEMVARSAEKAENARLAIAQKFPQARLQVRQGDTGHLTDMRRVADELLGAHAGIDVLIHNAGALDDVRSESPEGIETTVASQVVGPFVLGARLLPALERQARATGRSSRIVWVASGGMYSEPLDVGLLEMPTRGYDGTVAYARAKRAQVTLTELMAARLAPRTIVVQAMHPGWADTPGVARSLPTFRKVMGPLLRSAEDGANTLVWLASDDGAPLATSGLFWLDRRPRPLHRLTRTQKSDTQSERRDLVKWLEDKSGERW
jgi:NAD(P)-dependent dehydrogenase (short-subunit alcohol dehydrogenase family)